LKRIIFTLCIFFALLTSAKASEYYNCVDQNGNTVLTTSPQDGMKCEMTGEDDEVAKQAEKARQKAEESMIKCVTEQSGGFVNGGFVNGGFIDGGVVYGGIVSGGNVSGVTFYRVCRDKNGKGKVVSRERI
jgi:Domain of unknown function (DUF4124)